MKALWVPVVVYLVATLGVPLLHPLDARFSEHLIIVLTGTAAVMGAAALVRAARRVSAARVFERIAGRPTTTGQSSPSSAPSASASLP